MLDITLHGPENRNGIGPAFCPVCRHGATGSCDERCETRTPNGRPGHYPAADLEPGTRVVGTVPGGERVAGTVVQDRGARVMSARGATVTVLFDGRTSPVPFAVAQLATPRSVIAAALVATGIAPGPVLS